MNRRLVVFSLSAICCSIIAMDGAMDTTVDDAKDEAPETQQPIIHPLFDRCAKAIDENNVDEVSKCIGERLDITKARSQQHRETLLHRTNNLAIAKLFIQHGADINAPDAEVAGPLHALLGDEQSPNLDVVTYFLENKADVHMVDHHLSTPLHFLAINGQLQEQ